LRRKGNRFGEDKRERERKSFRGSKKNQDSVQLERGGEGIVIVIKRNKSIASKGSGGKKKVGNSLWRE
jgi:hypothetical protein